MKYFFYNNIHARTYVYLWYGYRRAINILVNLNTVKKEEWNALKHEKLFYPSALNVSPFRFRIKFEA